MNKRNNKGTSDLLYIEVKDLQIEKALKIFKQRVKESGLLLDLKENAFYTKPSEKRRTIKNIAKLRYNKDTTKDYKKLYWFFVIYIYLLTRILCPRILQSLKNIKPYYSSSITIFPIK